MADVNRILKLDRVYAKLDYLKITLPSDPDWQLSTYKKLVEKQRDMSKQETMIDDPISVASSLKVGYLFETAFHKSSKETDGLLDDEYLSEVEKELAAEEFDRNTELWTNREVVLAAKVLSSKTPKRHGIKFASDNQMRRVYDIIFEVFRYRTIINEILNNIDFENIYQNYTKMTLLVWLMSFDYYRNKFKPRKLDENETISFKTLKLLEIADILKDIKIQLAASFSKFRIKHCALSLSDMLPRHLRNERFKKSSETVISCWINTFLTSPEYVETVLNKAGLTQMKNFEDLVPETYKMDHLLPYFIHIYPKEKSEFLNKMPLFQKYLLILQERRYCLGPAMLDRTMSANKLCGNVAQTHFTIQTAVAYLASLLFKRKQSLIVYGAAERKSDYYNYFVNLGVQNCKLIADDFLRLSSNNQLSLDIVSILATPPNTNTGVTDPVQLVCSKGGDLTLLRAVASLDYTEESSNIPCMLDQRDTLRMAMSKPQINLSTRLSNFNISNPLHYLYNENADLATRGRPMSASTLSATYQESPRRSRLVKRPQSADTINKIAKSRHIAFDFSDQQNDTGLGNHRMDLEKTFDELDADELSSDGLSSPALLLQDDRPQDCGDDSCDGPALEPGLTSKPPIPPVVGNGHAASPDSSFGHRTAAVTFDDAIELKFQRWFPNSAPIAPAAVPSEGTADVSLNGVSYEYSERVIDNDRGTVTYTRSSSSMSIRGSQDQLDEEHLYSNLSAAIGGADKLCRGSVSVDMLEILQNDDNRRAGAPARPKPKKKKTPAPAAVAPKVKRDAPKSVLKSRTNAAVTAVTCKTEPSDGETVRHEHQQAPEKEARKDNPSRKPDDSPVDYATEDVVSWMSSHQLRSSTSELDDPFISRVDDKHCDEFHRDHNQKTSTYDEIVNILKELESENNDIDMNVRKSGVTHNNKRQTLVPEPSSSSKALWSFLDEVEKNSNRSTPSKSPRQKLPVNLPPTTPPSSPKKAVMDVKKGNLQQVMEFGKAELAQRVASLQMQLAEKEDVTEKLKITVAELQAEHAKSKAEYESTVTRHQKFIDKLLSEKKELSESCASTVKELTKKMNNALASQEERHKVEMKKAVDKQTASEKIKKDRWVDLKTKKIKEMTIKGIEPELNRMSTAYQEELSELRRIHQSQIEEIEGTWHRRMAAMRDKMDTEREQAIVTERESSRNRLETEIAELEKSYQEQRKRLLGEIHGERLRQERENDVALMEKQRALEQKFEKLVAELQDKIHKKEEDFQNELKNIRETYESEKTKWIKHQTTALAEKENAIKEMCKKERDKHIELVVQKLENEASERENTSETKIKRIKSEYEADIHELENTISGHRLKLNEARTKAQEQDDKIAELTSELNKCHNEQKRLEDVIGKLKDDLVAKENTIKTETLTKVGMLQTELTQSKLNFQTKIKTIESEKEREINHVYVRVKEAIKRKDEAIQVLQSERDAALDQCSNIERLLERQRKELLKLK